MTYEVRPMGSFYAVLPPVSKRYPKVPAPASAEMVRAWAEARRDAQPQRVYCALCESWDYAGTAGECREAALEHRRAHHPETFGTKRRRALGSIGIARPTYRHTEEQKLEARRRGTKARHA